MGKHTFKCLGCGFVSTTTENNFHRLPKPIERRNKWLKSLNRSDLINTKISDINRVCKNHFSADMMAKSKKKLKRSAVPILKTETLENIEIAKGTKILTNITQDVLPIKLCPLNITVRKFSTDACFDIADNVALVRGINETDINDSKTVNDNLESVVTVGNIMNVCNKSIQTSTTVNFEEIEKLKKENEELKKINKELEKKLLCQEFENDEAVIEKAYKLLPEELVKLFESHGKNSVYKHQRWRYSNDMNKFCLSIYFNAPVAYNFFAEYMNLPSKKTLSRFIKHWSLGPGLNESLFNGLKLKIKNLPDIGKNCLICIDEISLKTNLYFDKSSGEIIGLEDDGENKTKLPAKYALVVLIRGITHNYSHLVGYYYVNSTCSAKMLKEIIFKCVKFLINVNIKPRLIISDQGSNFIGLNKLLGISSSVSYFYAYNYKIYYMYDTPHLLKSFWKSFIKYDIVFDNNKKACWNDVVNLYLHDKNQQFKLAPKLSKVHIAPNSFQKMTVKYAAQAISWTISRSLYTLASDSTTSSTTVNTAEVIEKFDQLFDIFNSCKFDEPKKFRKPFFGHKDQLHFLSEMKVFISNINFFDGTKNVTFKIKFLKGWLQNINILTDLHNDLKLENISFVLTNYLNLNVLENEFGTLRKRGGNKKILTPFQFACSFKNIFSVKYMEDITPRTNCEPTERFQTLDFYDTDLHLPEEIPKQMDTFNIHFDYKIIDFGEADALYNFGDYLLRKYRAHHNCSLKLIANENIGSQFEVFEENDDANLIKSPENFINIFKILEDKFVNYFNSICTKKDIENKLFEYLKNDFNYKCCNKYDNNYFIKMYIRIRIYFVLKNFNKHVKQFYNEHKFFSMTHE